MQDIGPCSYSLIPERFEGLRDAHSTTHHQVTNSGSSVLLPSSALCAIVEMVHTCIVQYVPHQLVQL